MSFWAQFLISSVGGGALSTAVGLTVGFLMRRWLKPILGGQQEIKQLAQTAVDQSTHAAARATGAEEQSKKAADSAGAANESAATAGDNSRQANAALEFLAERYAAAQAANEDLRERVDRLLGTRARQVAVEQQPRTGGLLIPLDAGDDSDPTTVTGKHRLHSQRIQTIDEGDHS